MYFDLLETSFIVQSALLGPRLILGVREHHAKLTIDSDAGSGTSMISIAFQDRVHVSTCMHMSV